MSIDKINQGSSPIEKPKKSQGSGKPTAVGESEKQKPEGAIAVLSGQSNELGATSAPFDAEKVAQIKQAISKGEFKINTDAIADKIIQSAQELLGKN